MIAGDGVRIRRARRSDLDAMLAQETLFASDRMSRASLRRFLVSPRARLRVAVDANGSLLGNLILLTRRDSTAARIYSVVVDPAARGRGIGARLVRAAERDAIAMQCSAVSLEVRADNAVARALYRGLGYLEARRLPGYYDDGADGLRLHKTLGAQADATSISRSASAKYSAPHTARPGRRRRIRRA